MRNFARRKHRISRVQRKFFLSYFHDELAFNHIEPPILVVLQRSSRVFFHMKGVFDNKDTITIFWRYFESNNNNPLVRAVPLCNGIA